MCASVLDSKASSRLFTVFLMLLMVFSLFTGIGQQDNSTFVSWGSPVYATEGNGPTSDSESQTQTDANNNTNKGVDDLWGEVSTSQNDNVSIGENLRKQTVNLGTVVSKAQSIAKAFTGILTIISFAALLFYVTKLALSAGNPQTRRQAIVGILVAGAALALFGGAWVVVSFFWNILN